MTIKTLPVLNGVKIVLFLVMVIMFINFNAEVAKQSLQTKAIAANTNGLIQKQDDILFAIKQVTDDTHTTAAQQTAIIICMLQVPVNQRTPDLQSQCRSISLKNTAINANTYPNSNSTSGDNAYASPSPSPTPTPAPQSSTKPTPTPAPVGPVVVPPVFDNLSSFLSGLFH